MDLNWQKLSQKEEKVGYKWVVHKRYKMPDGTESDWTTMGRADIRNVAVIALTLNGKVVVSRMFRPGPERIMEEIPGGFVDEGEELEAAARRELQEETGYTTERPLEFIGTGRRDAYKNDSDNYFIAYDCQKVEEQATDSNEFIEVAEIPISQLIENAKTGNMTDGVAVLMAYERLKKIEANG